MWLLKRVIIMKKHFFILIGCAFFILSCGSTEKQSNDQIIIDSTVNARVAARDAENARKNDSTINAEARLKAATIQNELERSKKNASTANTAPASPSLKHQMPDSGAH